MGDDAYDWRDDSYKSWQVAIQELRLRGLRAGTYEPRNDEERDYVDEHRRRKVVVKLRAIEPSKHKKAIESLE